MSRLRKLSEFDKKVIKAMWQWGVIGNLIIVILSMVVYGLTGDIRETISISGRVTLGILAITLIILPIYALLVKNSYKKMTMATTIAWVIQFGTATGLCLLLFIGTFIDFPISYEQMTILGVRMDSTAGIPLNFFFGLVIIMIAAYYQDKMNEEESVEIIPV